MLIVVAQTNVADHDRSADIDARPIAARSRRRRASCPKGWGWGRRLERSGLSDFILFCVPALAAGGFNRAADVLFRLEYTIRDLRIAEDDVLTFDYDGPHHLQVVLRKPSADEQSRGHKAEHGFCTATSQVEANQQNHEVFLRIASNQVLPPDADHWTVGLEYTGPDGTRIRLPGLSGFPQHFQSFLDGVRAELADFAKRTVSVLRWRANSSGPHDPISVRGMHWSVDGTFWHPAPARLTTRVMMSRPLRISAGRLQDVEQMVRAGQNEPLHHDLLREAWEQYHSNPRSALVIGIAAAELAIKDCVSTLVPQAEWLVTNLPTPPLTRMLSEFLPTLPAVCLIDGRVKAPPETVLATIKKGVAIRNQLAHAGNVSPAVETAEEILNAVHDVLWLLDYYSGHEWALTFLRAETRSQLVS